MAHVATDAPTQTVFPWKAALRTGVQVLLSASVLLALIAPLVSEFIEQFWPGSPVVASLAGAVVFVSALAALVSRIMAIPAVNELLTKFGLGAAPKRRD